MRRLIFFSLRVGNSFLHVHSDSACILYLNTLVCIYILYLDDEKLSILHHQLSFIQRVRKFNNKY